MTKGLLAATTTTTTTPAVVATTAEDFVRQLWVNTDCVCFDVDSTVCTEEAIDELAKYQKVGPLVEAITRNAMGGTMSFRTALQARLNLIQASRANLEEFLIKHPSTLTDGISELVDLLHERKIPVYLITGGFHSIVDPVAEELNIPLKNVFANRLLFNNDGSYAGFDEEEMTSDSGGKGRVIEHLRNKFGYKRIVMIGDGATDMEAEADGFIGFGGNVVRESVRACAPWFVKSFYALIDELRNHSTASSMSCSRSLPNENYAKEIEAK